MKVKQHIRISLSNSNTNKNVYSNSLELISSKLDVNRVDDDTKRISYSRKIINRNKSKKSKSSPLIISNTITFKVTN